MFEYDTDSGEIFIYDQIGPAWAGMIDAGSVREALKAIGANRTITLRVSSPGGSVWDAVDIYNMIDRHVGRVIAEVDGLAASAASFLILAADEVRAAKNSMFMIHRAWSVTIGDANEHAKTVEMLEKVDDTIVQMYGAASGQSNDTILAAMDAETWMTASEALEWGLIDQIIGERDGPATVPEGMYRHTPAGLIRPAAAGSRTKWTPRRNAARAAIGRTY